MAAWYVTRTSIGSSTVIGPYEDDELKRMLEHGLIAQQDQVSLGDKDPWRPITDVPGIVSDPSLQAGTQQPEAGGKQGVNARNNVTAAILAILLGSFGAHKFYNGSTGWAILYLALCWTGLPGVAALIEGIRYLGDQAGYDRKYNRTPEAPWKW